MESHDGLQGALLRLLAMPTEEQKMSPCSMQTICLLVLTCIGMVWVLLELSGVLVPLTFAVFLAFLVEPMLEAVVLAPERTVSLWRRTSRCCGGSGRSGDNATGDDHSNAAAQVRGVVDGTDQSAASSGIHRGMPRPPASGPTDRGTDVEGADEVSTTFEQDPCVKDPCCRRAIGWLQGLWDFLAILMCTGAIFLAGYGATMAVVQAFKNFDWSKYQNSPKIEEFKELLGKLGIHFQDVLDGSIFSQYQGEVVTVALAAVGVLKSVVLTLLLFFFALVAMLPGIHNRRPRSQMKGLMQRYLLMKTIASFIIAVACSISLWLMNVDLVFIFGIITFTLNFIPNIGSFFAILAPVPLVWLQEDKTLVDAVMVALVPFLVHNSLGNVMEPKLMSSGLDLHSLTVVVALTFWGSMWGIAGAILSVPITCAIRLWLLELNHPYAKILRRLLDEPMGSGKLEEASQEPCPFRGNSGALLVGDARAREPGSVRPAAGGDMTI